MTDGTRYGSIYLVSLKPSIDFVAWLCSVTPLVLLSKVFPTVERHDVISNTYYSNSNYCAPSNIWITFLLFASVFPLLLVASVLKKRCAVPPSS